MAKNKREAAAGERQARKRRALKKTITKIVIGVGVVALLGAFFIPRAGSYSPGSSGAVIDGVQSFLNTPGHTTDPVLYPQSPPAGGPHHPTWLNCGVYSQAVPNVYAVHALEHGAVWVTYDSSVTADQLAQLREHLPSTYVVLSPYAGLPSPIVLSAWNKQLRVQSPDDPRIPEFFEEYWRSQNVPEPGALCTGGIDGPGRVS